MDEKKIITVGYNWRFSPENGEEFDSGTVGYKGVTEITEHSAKGDGDKWFWDIVFDTGKVLRVFNINFVLYAD